MTAFRINLIREIAPSRRRRQRWFVGMVAYVALFGILTAACAWQLTGRIVHLSGRRQALDVQDKWFRQRYPDVTQLQEYAEDLRLGLEHCGSQLSGIQTAISRRMDLPPVVLALLEPMTPGMRLISFAVDREKKSLGFEVAVPAMTFERRRAGESDIMSSWNDHPVLKTRMKSIVLIGSRRARGPTGFEYVLSFNGTLKDLNSSVEP